MPASAHASHPHSDLDLALNGGKPAYSPVLSSTHLPHLWTTCGTGKHIHQRCEFCLQENNGSPTDNSPCPNRPAPQPVLFGDASIVQPLETSAPNAPDADPLAHAETMSAGEAKQAFEWELTPLEHKFRHGFWSARRDRTYAALQAAGISIRRLVNFAQCGSSARVLVNSETGQVRVQATYCHDRFCEACQRARTYRLAAALRARIGTAKCLHVVLTVRSRPGALKPQLDRLYAASRKLRETKLWTRCVTGGSQTVEVTRNQDTGEWHPHLHLLVHCDWLPQDELSRTWLKVTGDSTVVHVSLVQKTDAAAREVTKYLGKPIHRSIDFHQAALVETIIALKGRRLIGTFGSWRSDPLLTEDAPEDNGTWRFVCTLDHLHVKASQGDAWSRAALLYLTSLMPGRTPHPAPPILNSS